MYVPPLFAEEIPPLAEEPAPEEFVDEEPTETDA